MRRFLIVGLVSALLATGLPAANALTGSGGYEATLLFTADDVESEVSVWSDLVVAFGDAVPSYPGDAVAVDSSGNVFVQLYGYENASDTTWYSGVVRSDADDGALTDILQQEWSELSGDSYGLVRNIAIAPVTNGLLTKDDLVILRDGYDAVAAEGYMEIIVLDPDAPSTTTQIHEWTPGGFSAGGGTHLAIDASTGDIYFLQDIYDSSDSRDGSVRRLTWNAAAETYTESTITSADTAVRDLIVDADGFVYSFDADDGSSSEETIIQIDPTGSDDYSDYAYVDVNLAPSSYYAWAWDSTGTFWVAEFGVKKSKRLGRIAEVKEGKTVSSKDKIAECGEAWIYGMTAGAEGSLYVVEADSVYVLVPGDDDGGGKPPKKK